MVPPIVIIMHGGKNERPPAGVHTGCPRFSLGDVKRYENRSPQVTYLGGTSMQGAHTCVLLIRRTRRYGKRMPLPKHCTGLCHLMWLTEREGRQVKIGEWCPPWASESRCIMINQSAWSCRENGGRVGRGKSAYFNTNLLQRPPFFWGGRGASGPLTTGISIMKHQRQDAS